MSKRLDNFLKIVLEDAGAISGGVTNTVGSGTIAGVGVPPSDPNQAKADPTFAIPPGLLGVLNRVYKRKKYNNIK